MPLEMVPPQHVLAPQRQAVALDRLVGHREEDVEGRLVRGDQVVLRGELDHAQGQVADALELAQHAHHRHHEPQVGGHRCLAHEQVVAALGEREVHGVDLVVVAQRLLGDLGVAAAQDLAHALEVLIDADRHHLDLEPELLQLLGVLLAHGAAVGHRSPVSRSGR